MYNDDEEEEEEEEEEELQVVGWSKLTESPAFPSGRTLRPYQIDGLNWLRLNWYLQRNVILGDEMGLGKTAQSLALLHTVRTMERVEGPFLIVAPLSTLPHCTSAPNIAHPRHPWLQAHQDARFQGRPLTNVACALLWQGSARSRCGPACTR